MESLSSDSRELALDILLVEEEGSAEEGDDDIAAPHHRNDGNHRTFLAECFEIGEVSHRQEERDEKDGPAPTERLFLAFRVPENEHHAAHDEHDIDVARSSGYA